MKILSFGFALAASALTASWAQASAPCDLVQVSGTYSTMSPETRAFLKTAYGISSNVVQAKKTEIGYELELIESIIPSRLGQKAGSFGTLSLQPELSASYCAATLFRQEGIKHYRIAMAPNGDLILSSLDQLASDGSVIPELVLYKSTQ